ncbi:PocR ligand-binding domain-containing protein [Endozoicomonas sp. SESOKO1]|uniref:PocR ligand-binding domain-containing protein n=1 Tax=Endozoicomonas sp. SESOKO1 TaxID=2828742 RepID=UPI0021491B2C|nr:PocR ligand-binding domain-containing protein [Endozoicomonas sp. SESOKO1]
MKAQTSVPDFINNILYDFSAATGLASVLVDIKGNEISTRCNFSPFCDRIRSDVALSELCNYCDRSGGINALRDNDVAAYICHTGLVDFSVPLIHRNNLLGFIQCGQIKVTNSGIPSICTSPSHLLVKDQQLITLYEEIESFPLSKIQSSINLLKTLVDNYVIKFFDLPINEDMQPQGQRKNFRSLNSGKKIDEAILYINNNISSDLDLDIVSNHVNLSPYYFSKAFKKQVGVGFNSYLKNKRLSTAKALLSNTKMNIENIAKKSGFNSASYFIKQFKSHYMTTPYEYRKEIEDSFEK